MVARFSLLASAMLAIGVIQVGDSQPAIARAATYVFEPRADASVDSRRPGTNFGTKRTLRVDGRPRVRSYLRFNVRGLDGPVQQARLLVRSRTRSGRLTLRGVAPVRWGEKRIKYRNAPRLRGIIGRSEHLRRHRWTAIDATSAVRREGTVNLGLATRAHTVRRLFSRESKHGSPRLVVDTPTSAAPRIAGAGDIACDPSSPAFNGGAGTSTACRQRFTSDLLVGRGLASVLPLGDLQYEEGVLADFLTSYHPSWGRVQAITRPVPGNHEYRTPGAAGYFDYFNGSGRTGGPAGERGRGYYSYQVGTWLMIALNSACSEVGGCGEGSPQNVWLKRELASAPHCVLAYWHRPRFSSGRHGGASNVGAFWDELYDAGADVVLNGHEHFYERFAPQDPNGSPDREGIRQFTVGTGGRSLRGIVNVAPNSEIQETETFGILELTLRRSGYDWRFVPEAGATFADAGSGSC